MKLLFIGDIVGKPGREAVLAHLDALKETYKPDFTIANGENAAHGKGISSRIYHQFKNAGIDCVTLGNHAFSKDVIKTNIDDLDDLIRPMNLEPLDYGQGYNVYEVNHKKICVTNICGAIFMERINYSPFEAMDRILEDVEADYYIVDLHGEATSEKAVFANYYKDRIHAVLGTHTHVQTADERIIGKLAFISDVGMTGPYNSIIGRDVEEVIQNMVFHEKTKFEVAVGPAILQAVIVEFDDETNSAIGITRIQIKP